MTMIRLTAVALAGAVMLGIAPPASSHHSHAMFDTSREVTVTGTVTGFSYRNPHVFLYLEVKGDDGNVVPWSV
jgi:hypothetical protein